MICSLRQSRIDFFSKEFYAGIYVECVHQCSDSVCSSDCAREFNDNLPKEKSRNYCWSICSPKFLLTV